MASWIENDIFKKILQLNSSTSWGVFPKATTGHSVDSKYGIRIPNDLLHTFCLFGFRESPRTWQITDGVRGMGRHISCTLFNASLAPFCSCINAIQTGMDHTTWRTPHGMCPWFLDFKPTWLVISIYGWSYQAFRCVAIGWPVIWRVFLLASTSWGMWI